MFDYSKWQIWLEQMVALSASDGIKAELKFGSHASAKPGMAFGITGVKAMGSFECWITGETDYTIMAPVSSEAKMVSHKWMQILTDGTFEATFNEFMVEFRKYENLPLS